MKKRFKVFPYTYVQGPLIRRVRFGNCGVSRKRKLNALHPLCVGRAADSLIFGLSAHGGSGVKLPTLRERREGGTNA